MIPRQCPRRPRGRRHRRARTQPHGVKPRLDIGHQPALAPEQMRDPARVQSEPVLAIDLDQWRPARRPPRQPCQQGGIPRRVGGDRAQFGVERAGVGQPHSRPDPGGARDFGRGDHHRPVPAFAEQRDPRVRFRRRQPLPPLQGQSRQPDRHDPPRRRVPAHPRPPSARADARARGTARPPSAADPAPWD